MNSEIIHLDTVDDYNRLFGLETQHPLVSVVDLTQSSHVPTRIAVNYGIYALFLKNTRCGDIRYGRQIYDYSEGTITSFAPGQVVEVEMQDGVKPSAQGIVFHPDLIRGTALGREMKLYTFFSYSSTEALHVSEEERGIILDCLQKIRMELERPIDQFSKRLIASNIHLLLEYCLRFYNRQFVTRAQANKDVLMRFETLLDDYFQMGRVRTEGLPNVRYFAERVFLSPNYFGDLIKKSTGKTPQEYIQTKIIDTAKELLLGSRMTVCQIADELGFQYPQHFNRLFKKNVGITPNEYRKVQMAG